MAGVASRLVWTLKWLPVLFVLAVTLWSYYAFVAHFLVATLDSNVQRVVLAALYHVFLVLYLWSYAKVVLTNPGRVPPRFRLSSVELEELEMLELTARRRRLELMLSQKDLHVATVSMQREVRFCADCCQIKPDRSHHCSICSRCVLKMDHHCPWVNNCVGFRNYKFFVLFLLHALLYCLFIAAATLSHFLAFWADANSFEIDSSASSTSRFHVLFMFFVSAMFSVSLGSLFGYHCYLTSQNLTTIEAIRYPVLRASGGSEKRAFHLGVWGNVQEVFGDNMLLWFVSIASSFGDGITFPLRHSVTGDEESGLLPINKCNRRGGDFACEAEERAPMMMSSVHGEEETSTSSSITHSSDESNLHGEPSSQDQLLARRM